MPRISDLTPLGVASLALLAEEPMHPYEMYQLLMARHEDRLVKVRPGTLYHAVGRLEDNGLVEATGTEREGNRPERTLYRITDAGKDALDDRLRAMLSTPVNEYPLFPHAIAEAHHLPAADVMELLEERVVALAADLDFLLRAEAVVTAKGLDRKYWIDISYQQAMRKTEIAWIRGLLEELGNGHLPWDESLAAPPELSNKPKESLGKRS
ncbi:DNA-binding PadR family transcriptional regulator [Paenarthrobacter nicotinovorans]|uniref:PadR family transcriptional regulator n=1 Tax=Micrococcaceae TaxID=1268 RepID=UPI0004796F0D|nr:MULTISPECIES: PadR family transcriptional regulator [Micrococcaceae]MDR6435526.1 DNA-binding PadR family transcriptional regulator [Paenarthrobacter nicotinovorans]SCZ49959.1 DNA-binding transcriptional regulator, PadR family [Arthrobacter sp. UNCCL28]